LAILGKHMAAASLAVVAWVDGDGVRMAFSAITFGWVSSVVFIFVFVIGG
jgi:hypothetical protein